MKHKWQRINLLACFEKDKNNIQMDAIECETLSMWKQMSSSDKVNNRPVLVNGAIKFVAVDLYYNIKLKYNHV